VTIRRTNGRVKELTIIARPEGADGDVNAILPAPLTAAPTPVSSSPRARDVPASDAELLRGCRNGDARSWDELVGRYERLVYSVALRNGLDDEDAADATQNTFLALMNTLDQLQSEDRLAFWLMTVARRQAWRIARRREHDVVPEAEITDVDDPIERWERASVVHEALHRLDSPCRELLAALYFDPDAPSYAIIAARLGRTIGGIGPMRGRCLGRLRALLGEEGS
jgi:RNA polymerase sigma factor (sigma-70 family)